MTQADRVFVQPKTYHQRGATTMTQGVLPFKYEKEKTKSGMTALAGLPVYLDLAKVIGLSKSIHKHLKIKENSQGWTDSQMVLSLILLNLAGGDCIDDLKILEADEGFCKVLRKTETHGLKRKVRRSLERRWRKEKRRTVPSPSAAFRYLAKFHNAEQEKVRRKTNVKAFIPSPNKHLKGMKQINKDLSACMNKANIHKTATLDMDATLAKTTKKNALYCYKGFKSFQLPTMQIEEKKYKVFGIVTNIDYEKMNGEDLIHWLHERCGKSEEVHAIMKDDLAGGKLPSADFGENAAWWWIMILALNLNMMMKKLALDSSMETTRMKRIRFSIINIPGRIIKRSRSLILRLSKGHPSYEILLKARKQIAMLYGAWEPSG